MSGNEQDEEQEILIYMDFNTKMDDDFFSTEKEFKIIGLDEERPILQLGNQVYLPFHSFPVFHGEWRDAMGTHIFLEESKNVPVYDPIFSDIPDLHMQYACKTDKVLHLSRIFVNPKNENRDNCASEDNKEQTKPNT